MSFEARPAACRGWAKAVKADHGVVVGDGSVGDRRRQPTRRIITGA
jgi:hypothetical protein